MGLDFNFDEISLDQKASRDQLEIDLYDELVTISDSEPEDQVRLLAVARPAAHPTESDRPESIRITGSLSKEQRPRPGVAKPPEPTAGQSEPFVIPARVNGAKSQHGHESTHPRSVPLPGVPVPGAAPQAPVAPPLPLPKVPQRSQTAAPSDARSQLSAARPDIVPDAAQTRVPAPGAPQITRCANCGQPAGDLDMICIECGAFIG